MVYAYDQWAQLPVRDLYDSQIMAMAINAAKDMYEKGQQEMKDFQKAYGDFLTPIMADQDWYNQNVTGKVRDAVNALYAQGIDPLRNAQGRAVISQLINNMPYGDIAKKRIRAKNAEEYYKNMAALRLNDKYNEDFSKFLREDPSQWDPDFAGVTSPTAFKTLKDATDEWYNNRTPRDLTPEEKKQLGLDPRYKYTGYFDSDLMNVAKGQTPGWQGTPISNYYRELAKRKLQSAGVENPTAEQVEAVLQRDIANAQQEWLVGPTQGNADEFVLDDYRTANDIKANRAKAATDYYYSILPAADTNGDGKLSNEERASYAKLQQQALSGKGNSKTGDGNTSEDGYSLAKDVYTTSLAKAAGIEYLPSNGVSQNDLSGMLKQAVKYQNNNINSKGSVLAATGMFISPEKVAGLIQSNGKNGQGYFLNPGYFKNLHDIQDIRTSYKGWARKGFTAEESKIARKEYKQRSKDIISDVRKTINTQKNKGEFRLKVVPVSDENGNNIYGMVGEDNRWHTYARVRVYLSDGKNQTAPGGIQRPYEVVDEMGRYIPKEGKIKPGDKSYKTEVRDDIPRKGVDMLLEIGLHSNEGKASPDLSVSAREDLGPYAFQKTKSWIGQTGNADWAWGTNIMSNTE